MKKFVMAAVAATALMTIPAMADPAAGVKAGVLTCNVDSGWGFVFGSSKELKCTYAQPNAKPERYVGTISKFGVDIGYSASGIIVWGVFAPTGDVAPGSLGGDYGGATGGAAVIGGVSANVLVGGFNHSMTLQPLSIEGYTGVNVAAGIAVLNLKPQS